MASISEGARHKHEMAREPRARAQLAREQRLQLALTAAQLHIWTVELRTGRVTASDGVRRILGFAEHERVERGTWWRRTFPADRKRVWSAFRALIDGQAGFDMEYRVRWPNGEIRWIDSQAIMLHDEDDRPAQIFGVAADISRQKETERELYRRQQEFKTLVENAPDIISRLDRDLRHLYINPAATAAWGIEASAYLGRSLAELGLPDSMVRPWREAARACFGGGKEQRFNFSVFNGEAIRHYATRLIPEFDREGKIESLLAVTYDETERTEVEIERDALLVREQAARVNAEAATRARDEFLAVVSHELRSPLNGIQSWAHVLESQLAEPASALARRALQGIRTGVAQQVRLIEDLLDMTRVLSGTLRLVRQPTTLRPAIDAAVESVRALAQAKRIALDVSHAAGDEQVEGDRDRLQQIVWNLLSNAVKFTPEGGRVWLSTFVADDCVCVTVRDNGKGVAPAFLPNLFLRFQQADTSSTRGHDGLGLGLSLVRHLVELHEGRIVAASDGEGMGATFTVSLPRRVRDDAARENAIEREPALPSLERIRILLIDDQDDAREAMWALLAQSGAQVAAAASGREALAYLERCAAGQHPQIVLCDIAMPNEDGYGVLRRIRAWERHRLPHAHPIPAVALTAFAQKDDRLRALASGFQMHLAKPVAPAELGNAVLQLLQR